jgi:spermidine/putrescine transport system substrate-binding protein
MGHPRDARSHRPDVTRREFLRRAALAGVAVPSAAAILAACGTSSSSTTSGGSGGQQAGGVQLARPDNPVTFPISSDNPPVQDGLSPEAGPLRVYNWGDYTYKKVIKEFEDKYGVDVEVSDFSGMSEAIAKIRSGAIDFDVFFPTIDVLGKLVAAKLVQPINLSYVPNLQTNVWPSLADPFYDKGSRYTVPYMTWKTGIGYRRDLIQDDPFSMENPYDLFWDPKYKGKIGVYDEYRDTMGMAILRNGHVSVDAVNTSDPQIIDEAMTSLVDMSTAVNPQVGTGDYQRIAEGTNWIHLMWSGNAAYTQYYLPKDTSTDVLGFWFPDDGRGMIGSDTITIGAKAKSPVLAHLYLNHLLDTQVGLTNMSYEGYMPPQITLDPTTVVSKGYYPKSISTAVVLQSDFDSGFQQLELAPDVDAMWQNAWAEFKSGV